jgi:hypothetical protein
MSEIVLPMTKVSAETKSPKNLIIFSKPKVGKTTLLANLENCLILDLEDGSDYVDAVKLKAKSIDDIRAIGKAIKEAGYPYKYVAVDTITALEEMCIPLAEEMYSKSSMGKNWFTEGKPKYGSLLNMPNGAGYPWLREAFTKVVDYLKTWAPRIILVGHVKDVVLDKNGSEFNALDLDLTGYLFRKGGKNILSFKTTDEISCGARPEHLRNREVILSEIGDDDKLTTFWQNIYID